VGPPLYDGYCLRALAQRLRKKALKRVIHFPETVNCVETITAWSPAFQKKICDIGWEGLIAKDPAAPYVGRRERSWLKYKCAMSQAFAIGGFTDPKGSRVGFGAVLLGVYDDRETLHYAGKVGTGFDTRALHSLGARMAALETTAPPFIDPPRDRGIHWLRPELVAEVGFSEWTDARRLRHPRFLGLRDDKTALETRREGPR